MWSQVRVDPKFLWGMLACLDRILGISLDRGPNTECGDLGCSPCCSLQEGLFVHNRAPGSGLRMEHLAHTTAFRGSLGNIKGATLWLFICSLHVEDSVLQTTLLLAGWCQ